MNYFKCLPLLLAVFYFGESSAQDIDSLKFRFYQKKFHQFSVSDADSTTYYVNKLDTLTRPFEVSKFRYRYYNILGGWYAQKRNTQESLNAHRKSLEIAKKLKDNNGEVLSRLNVAGKLGDNGNLKEAISELKKLERIVIRTGKDYRIGAAMYGNLAAFSLSMKNVEEAYRYNSLMEKYAKNYSDSMRYFRNKLSILGQDKKYTEQVKYGEKVLNLLREGDLRSRSVFHAYIANGYLRLKSIEKAAEHLKEAKSIATQFGVEDVNISMGLGEIAFLSGDHQKALKYFLNVQTQAEKNKDARLLTAVLENIKNTYLEMGLYKQAFETQKEDFGLKDSLASESKKKYVAELEARFELKEKERTIAQHEETNALQSALIETEKRQKKLFLALLGISLLSLGFVGYLLRKIRKDRSEIRDQRDKIESYANRLEEANQMKNKLFALLSHDLRSPVSHLVNALKTGEPLTKAKQSLTTIQLILDNLLKWAGLQMKEARPFLSEVDILITAEGVVEQLQSQASDKNVQIITVYSHTHTIVADEGYVQIVIRNIVSNAIKFSLQDSFIKLSTQEHDNAVKLTVRDSGVGIAADKVASIFTYPVSSRGTHGETGSGLGLSLSKELLDKLSATIQVKSKEGIGTEITVWFPKYKTSLVENVTVHIQE